jgi:hypothetical protein
MKPLLVASSLLALFLALGGAAVAGEPTPAERFAQHLGAMPAPSEAGAFHFEGDLLAGGQAIGSLTMEGTPTALPSGQPGWRVAETMEMMGGSMRQHAEATLDRRLQPLEGTIAKKDPQHPGTTWSWHASDGGFAVTTTAKDGKSETRTVAHQGAAMTTLTALLLFSRSALPAKGDCAVDVFDPSADEAEKTFVKGTLTLQGEGTWDDAPALTIRATKPDGIVEAGFAPKGGGLLGLALTAGPGRRLEVRPASGGEKEASEEVPFAAPAASAEDAALAAALGFATADLDLIDRIVDWSAVYARERAKHEAAHAGDEEAEPFPEEKAFHAAMLASLRQKLTERPKAVIQTALKMAKPQLTTTPQEDGSVRVTFPASFRNLVLDVGSHDGRWYLVRFPGK